MLLGPKASHLQRVPEWALIPNQTSSFWLGPVQLLGLIPAEGASLATLGCFNLRGRCLGDSHFLGCSCGRQSKPLLIRAGSGLCVCELYFLSVLSSLVVL